MVPYSPSMNYKLVSIPICFDYYLHYNEQQQVPIYDAELQTKLAKTTAGRPLKGLLDGTETSLLRPNS
jgi:hypothetical protein